MANSAPDRAVALPRYIALRYVSAGRGSGLVSFMSAVSILGLALGIALLLTVLSIMNGFDREMRQNVLGIVPHITLRTENGLTAERWQALQSQLAADAGIVSVSPIIEMQAVVATEAGNSGVMANGVDPELESEHSAIDRFMLAGGLEELGDTHWGIVLGEPLARELGVDIGERVRLYSPAIAINPLTPVVNFREFKVSGIFRVGSQDLDSRLVLINRDAARALFRLRGPQNALWLRTGDVLEAQNLLQEIAPQLPADVTADSWVSQFGAVYENIRFSRDLISFLLWLLIAVAAFNLVVSLIMIVRDKRADIAVLRALGAEPGIINRIFMWQGALIGVTGIVLGLTAGILGSLYISDLARFIEASLGVELLNADIYPMDYLPSSLQFSDIVTVSAGVLLLSLLATIYPARRAAAVRPAVALRAE
ncbi:MAG: lipoprotein-releasing ABC transporter permease subunit [Gammaproteobacteria bacterium]|nr:lipoprotein-releasing ABC transporter permease subunit [Gammaproteobacteria bacterium]MYE30785.1 lipoprotein-releasing ABC transporter permease subunit [Gammaproteobacteria bacterium]